MAKRTFFDQWYRLAGLRVGLRAATNVRLHRYRHEEWYVYHEPVYGGYFRARPETHTLISTLTPDLTLGEVWSRAVTRNPETAPGQEEFFELVSSLYKSNLLFVEGPVSETRLLDRSLRKKAKPLAARISELFFLKVPLWDPDRFLVRNLGLIDRLFSPGMLAMFALLMLLAGFTFFSNMSRAFDQTKSLLEPANLILLFTATFVTHIFHEMAHAALCRHYGGSVRSVGLMFLIFTPLPYADVTSSWLLRNPWQRAAIGAAGMASDLVICSLATLWWAYSPPGPGNALALNVMFTTAVYTFVFNLNPLMRFDGYYILSDLTGIPNLHQRSKAQFDGWWRKLILSEPEKPDLEVSRRRRLVLIGFFITSFVYRTAVSLGIVLFLADQYFGLGLIGAAAIAYNTFGKPLVQAGKTLKNPHFVAKHRRPLRRVAGVILLLLACLAFLPVPEYRRLKGVVEAEHKTAIHTQVDGTVVQMVRPGTAVRQGDVLFQLVNPDLATEQAEIAARLRAARIQSDQTISQGSQTLAALEQEIASLQVRLTDLEARQDALVIHAPQDGIWTTPPKDAPVKGLWLIRGRSLGSVVALGAMRFRGMLPQEAAYGLADLTAERVSVRVTGDLATKRAVTALTVLPYSSKDLPSAALTPLAGGDTAVMQTDSGGLAAVERFFLIDALLQSGAVEDPGDGRTAWMLMRLPARPLLQQWADRLSQFLQQRYKL